MKKMFVLVAALSTLVGCAVEVDESFETSESELVYGTYRAIGVERNRGGTRCLERQSDGTVEASACSNGPRRRVRVERVGDRCAERDGWRVARPFDNCDGLFLNSVEGLVEVRLRFDNTNQCLMRDGGRVRLGGCNRRASYWWADPETVVWFGTSYDWNGGVLIPMAGQSFPNADPEYLTVVNGKLRFRRGRAIDSNNLPVMWLQQGGGSFGRRLY